MTYFLTHLEGAPSQVLGIVFAWRYCRLNRFPFSSHNTTVISEGFGNLSWNTCGYDLLLFSGIFFWEKGTFSCRFAKVSLIRSWERFARVSACCWTSAAEKVEHNGSSHPSHCLAGCWAAWARPCHPDSVCQASQSHPETACPPSESENDSLIACESMNKHIQLCNM